MNPFADQEVCDSGPVQAAGDAVVDRFLIGFHTQASVLERARQTLGIAVANLAVDSAYHATIER